MFPNTPSLNSSLSHTRQIFGQGSPQMPIHGCLQPRVFLHGLLHLGRLQGSLQRLEHLLCPHFQVHAFPHGSQGSPHSLVHFWWSHSFSQFREQGGHFIPQIFEHSWPHTRIRSHFCLHFMWRRPWKHSWQFPMIEINDFEYLIFAISYVRDLNVRFATNRDPFNSSATKKLKLEDWLKHVKLE